ncbi:predicted protein [Nematostella vectensis]|uniref:PPM-type phosphatase domain-containing protein n=1 Tax=Nematostella vectensis TaxID=45351 RepID=A7RI17_NEMVE|nr:predicted protein [Nematostella vectensis]|eukprot:XP_001641134.1 predicted protein [Nematostella vectensis]
MLHSEKIQLEPVAIEKCDDEDEGHSLLDQSRPKSERLDDYVLVKMNQIRKTSGFAYGFLKSHGDFARSKTSARHTTASRTVNPVEDKSKMAKQDTVSDKFASVTVNLISEVASERKDVEEDERKAHGRLDLGLIDETADSLSRRESSARENQSTEKGGEDSDGESSEQHEFTSVYSENSSEGETRLALPNIVLPCSKCGESINICRLQSHRDLHNALQVLKFAHGYKPASTNALIKRRKLIIQRMQESSAQRGDKGFSDRQLQKINTAFEILKTSLGGRMDSFRLLSNSLDVHVSEGRGDRLSCTKAVGVCEEVNARWKNMEDAHHLQDDFLPQTPSCFIGIYDGYCGGTTARKCASQLHQLVSEQLASHTDLTKTDFKTAFRRSYARFQELLRTRTEDEERSRNRWSGCSALTCVVTPSTCYLSHVGDVGAILIREDGVTKILTRKHDLYNKKERDRVRKSSGVIVKTEKCALVNGALGVTRGLGNIGDGELNQSVIIAPKFRCTCLTNRDQVLVFASSGLWKVFSAEEVANLVLGFFRQIKESVRKGIIWGSRVPCVCANGHMEFEGKKFAARYANCGAYYRKFLRPEPKREIGRPATSHMFNFMSYNELDNITEETPTTRAGLSVPVWFKRVGRRLSDTCIVYRDPDAIQDEQLNTSHERFTNRRHSLPHRAGMTKLYGPLGFRPDLSPQDKIELVAKSLAERIVKSALLAGSIDNLTVCSVLLPGFSLVNVCTITPELIQKLDRPVTGDW